MKNLLLLVIIMAGVLISACVTTETGAVPPPVIPEPEVAPAPIPEPVPEPISEPEVVPPPVIPEPAPEPVIEEPMAMLEPIDTVTVYFTEDSSVLSQLARTKLRTLASAIQERDDVVQEIRVVGHVAHAGTDAGRRRISLERAERVAALLGDLGVVRPIRTTARNSDEPAASNDTEEGKALNRRAIIMVVQQ